MLQFSRWKVLAILAMVLAGAVFALPNFLPKQWQETLRESVGLRPMTQGLDLQGGTSVLVEIDRKEFLDTLIERKIGDVRTALREARIGYKFSRLPNGFATEIIQAADIDKANELLKMLLANDEAEQVFTLQRSGQQLALVFTEEGIEGRLNKAVEQSLKILGNRLNGLGIAEASVQRRGKERILILLPGIGDPDRTVEKITRMAKLTFHVLCESQPIGVNDNPPPGCVSYPLKDISQQQVWAETSSAKIVDGEEINDATATVGYGDEPIVTFKFNQKGALQFGRITTDNVGKAMGIVLDQQVLSAPRIVEPILGGSGQISGNFTTEEANNLAVFLRSGALPARLVYIDAVNDSAGDKQAQRSDP